MRIKKQEIMKLYDREKPFNTLPLLPPDDKKLQSLTIMKKLVSANRLLAKLDGISTSLPNPNMLINTLTLQEARSSTEIENIFTTDDELYKAISTPDTKVNPAAKEVLKYRESLWAGVKSIQDKNKITEQQIKNIFQTIKETKSGYRIPTIKTVIRKGGSSITSGQVIYTPPRGEGVIEEKMKNWIDFVNDDKKFGYDPLLKMAISHYQFEAIHPFEDGNGRTGRILNLLVLINKGLLTYPILYLSKYIIQNKSEYYACLGDVTERGDWESWILYMLEAVEKTSAYTIGKIADINEQMAETSRYVAKKLPNIDKAVIESIYTQPYIRAVHLIGLKIKSRNTATKYLMQLEKTGVLELKIVGREHIYINKGLVDLLSN